MGVEKTLPRIVYGSIGFCQGFAGSRRTKALPAICFLIKGMPFEVSGLLLVTLNEGCTSNM